MPPPLASPGSHQPGPGPAAQRLLLEWILCRHLHPLQRTLLAAAALLAAALLAAAALAAAGVTAAFAAALTTALTAASVADTVAAALAYAFPKATVTLAEPSIPTNAITLTTFTGAFAIAFAATFAAAVGRPQLLPDRLRLHAMQPGRLHGPRRVPLVCGGHAVHRPGPVEVLLLRQRRLGRHHPGHLLH